MLHRQPNLILAALGLAISSCEGGNDPSETEIADPSSETMQDASLGPFVYEFDQTALTAADVDIRIPPDYTTVQSATKLIPEERAQSLGEESCTYGQSGQVSECNAEQEIGLALALLPRPVDEYRQAFEKAGEIADNLNPTELDEIEGFSFTAQAEGAGTEYRFFAIDQRTILLARTFDESTSSSAADAIEDVIDTLSQSVDRRIDS